MHKGLTCRDNHQQHDGLAGDSSVRRKRAAHLAKKFDTQWLCQYLCPSKVICDNRGEFISKEFLVYLHNWTGVNNGDESADQRNQRAHAFIGGRHDGDNDVQSGHSQRRHLAYRSRYIATGSSLGYPVHCKCRYEICTHKFIVQ